MLVRVKGNVIFQKTNTVNVTDLKKTGLECGAKRDFVPKLGYPSGRINIWTDINVEYNIFVVNISILHIYEDNI